MPAKYLLTAVAVAVIILGGVAAADAGLGEAGKTKTITNESFAPADAGNYTALEYSTLDGVQYADATEITVYDENGTEMIAGQDYDWETSNGTVQTLAGGRLVNDASANVTYGYAAPTQFQRSLAETFGGASDVATTFVFALVVGFVLVSIKALNLG